MTTISPFDPRANYTRIHNYALDYIMPSVKPNDWKVLCYIMRQTAGWGKDAERLSYSVIKSGTGIKSDATLSESLKRLIAENYVISVAGDKQWIATEYSLKENIFTRTCDGCSPTPVPCELCDHVGVEPTSTNFYGPYLA